MGAGNIILEKMKYFVPTLSPLSRSPIWPVAPCLRVSECVGVKMATGAHHQHRTWPGYQGKPAGQQQSAIVSPLSQSKRSDSRA